MRSWASMKSRIFALVLGVALAACSDSDHLVADPPSSIAAGQLTIALPKAIYTVAELNPASGQGIRATLGNSADQTFYSTVSYTHLRAHETGRNIVCRLLLEK